MCFPFRQSYAGGADTGGGQPELAPLKALLAKHSVPLWLNGHHHNTQAIRPAGLATLFVTSGAGSQARSAPKFFFFFFSFFFLHVRSHLIRGRMLRPGVA